MFVSFCFRYKVSYFPLSLIPFFPVFENRTESINLTYSSNCVTPLHFRYHYPQKWFIHFQSPPWNPSLFHRPLPNSPRNLSLRFITGWQGAKLKSVIQFLFIWLCSLGYAKSPVAADNTMVPITGEEIGTVSFGFRSDSMLDGPNLTCPCIPILLTTYIVGFILIMIMTAYKENV